MQSFSTSSTADEEANVAALAPHEVLQFRLSGPLRAAALVIGIVLGFVGLPFLLVGVAIDAIASQVDGPGSPALFPLAGSLIVVIAVAALVGGFASRMVLRPDGLLSVRSLPPWGRKVRLADLVRIEARPASSVAAGAKFSRTTRITLTEQSGTRLSFTAEAWEEPAVLMPALAAWAISSEAETDAQTRAYLLQGNPPLSVPPPSAAPA